MVSLYFHYHTCVYLPNKLIAVWTCIWQICKFSICSVDAVKSKLLGLIIILALFRYKTNKTKFSIVILHGVIEDLAFAIFKRKIATLTRSSNQNSINGIKVSQVSG